MSKALTKSLTKIRRQDLDIVGGKGLSLGLLSRIGVAVPDGFVITAHAFRRFLNETNVDQEIHVMWDKINFQDIESIESYSEIIRSVIKNAAVPKDIQDEIFQKYQGLDTFFVAVRSSATAEDSTIASWAGELESYLYITRGNLIEHVKLCWASLYTPRAIFYRVQNNMTWKEIAVAVIIQKMVNSNVSGVCFTVNPLTRNRDDMVIEAVYGLGEALAQGVVTPDQYLVDKKDNVIIDVTTHSQKMMYMQGRRGGLKEIKISKSKASEQKLSGKEIIQVMEACKKIEKNFRLPQDIEWAFEGNKLYILQSRPITTL